MIITLIERDNIGGLAKEIDLLKDLHVLALNKVKGKLGRDSIKATIWAGARPMSLYIEHSLI